MDVVKTLHAGSVENEIVFLFNCVFAHPANNVGTTLLQRYLNVKNVVWMFHKRYVSDRYSLTEAFTLIEL